MENNCNEIGKVAKQILTTNFNLIYNGKLGFERNMLEEELHIGICARINSDFKIVYK